MTTPVLKPPQKKGEKRIVTAVLVIAYLAAIIAANLSSARFGPEASIYNAFAFIGLNLTARDRLHDAWGRHRFRNMALLILAGSAVSYLATIWLTPDIVPSEVVARIALASFVAFLVAETLDAVGYQLLRWRPWLERANTSNLIGAAVDSTVFVSIAFGFTWEIVFAQFCAKVAGGFLWSLLLNRRREALAAA